MTRSLPKTEGQTPAGTGLIEAEGVTVVHRRRRWLPGRPTSVATPAVNEVSLAIEPGEHIALMGRSGSGKSTLARVLAGLMPPTAGRVRWSGDDVAGLGGRTLRRRRMAQVQYIWQDPYASLDPRCTVFETVRESVACHDPALDRDARARRVDVLLDAVTLSDRRLSRVAALSGGERRRLTVARALAARPAVLVADEPTTGLDPVLTLEMARLLGRVCRAPGGPTLVLITHDLDVARHTCRRVVVLDQGALIYQGAFDGLSDAGVPAIDALLAASVAHRLPAHIGRAREAGVATLEYLVVTAVATLTLGLLFYLLSHPIRNYLDFALWWLGVPLH